MLRRSESSTAMSLTARDIAVKVGVSEVTVRRWLKSGQLEGVRLGTGRVARYRIGAEALAAFVRPANEERP